MKKTRTRKVSALENSANQRVGFCEDPPALLCQHGQIERLEGAAVVIQMPHELPSIYRWVSHGVLGAPSILDQSYLDELKNSGVLFSGGDLERQYWVEATRREERVCFLNLDHPTVPNWLWVNELMFTEFGVRLSFFDFQ
ncbi:hypothetical protein PIB30_072646 [Stylosanthes scabra]|uniref:Uncharacterized protein n=1 Tax=Stylosanthes scabra TaxID=79078 RepID=A0ABU6XQ08_9FABA|nr:hypothetical protein [Stylosanthes scabra]